MGQGLFDCDTSGVDHTLIEKVREHRGYVEKVPYGKYIAHRELRSPPQKCLRGKIVKSSWSRRLKR